MRLPPTKSNYIDHTDQKPVCSYKSRTSIEARRFVRCLVYLSMSFFVSTFENKPIGRTIQMYVP